MQSIDIFPWNDNFNTGIADIDARHMKLVKLLNRLAGHVAFNSSLPAVDAIFNELLDYASYHFETEERIWCESLLSDDMAASHKVGHDSFLVSVLKLKEQQAGKGQTEVVEDILAFLTKWLASHILESDRYMALVVRATRLGMPLEQAKRQADREMQGAAKTLIDIILSIYDVLSANTLNLMREMSKRQEVSAQLIQQSQHFMEVIKHLPVGLIELDVEGNCIYVNQYWSELTGIDFGRALGKGWHKLLYPSNSDDIRHVLQSSTLGVPLFTKHQIQKADGTQLWIAGSVVRSRFGSAEEDGFIAVISDITKEISAVDGLKRKERELQLISKYQPAAIVRCDREMRYGFANEAYARLFDLQPDSIIGKQIWEVMNESAFSQAEPYIRRVLEGRSCHYELELETADDLRVLSVEYVPELDQSGSTVGFSAGIHDITESKRIASLEHYRRETLETLAQGLPLTDILNRIVSGVEELEPRTLCSLLQLDEAGQHLVNAIAPSLPDFYNQAIDGIEIGEGVGSCGTAAYRGERVIVEDIFQNPLWEPYRDLAAAAELRSCWSQPFHSLNGQILGTFAIYSKEVFAPQSHHILLMEEAGKLASIAIDRERDQQQLMIAAKVFESSEGMLVTDANTRILRVNKAFTDITGYSADEACGKTPGLLRSGRHSNEFYRQMWADLEAAGEWQGEIINRRKDGTVYPENLTITAVKNSTGSVINYVATLSDISNQKEAEDTIERLAFYDPLTHLPNRRLMDDRLEQAIATSQRTGNYSALLFIDLDNFKTLNDTLGHDIGDLLLQQVAQRLKSCVRSNDSVVRFGGDEFVVIVGALSKESSAAAAESRAVAEKILASFTAPFHLGSYESQSSCSIGIVLFDGVSGSSREELLKQADIAMYQAKKQGRNAMCFFDPQMQAIISQKVSLELRLRQALPNNQFQLYYQLQTDLLGRAVGAEVLLRWICPGVGFIGPDEFIPSAEETGLILPIGEWVLNTACAQLYSWQSDKDFRELTLSVNVSAPQIYQPGFVDQVLSIVKRNSINPARLKLELTESLMLQDVEAAIAVMSELSREGIQFSLDDFGTGYSSLLYLKKLPLSQLKIDQSFVADLLEDANDAAIVRTIISIAESMELEVLAEGVETEGQRQLLAKMGCDCFQGYLLGRPVTIGQFEQSIKQLSPKR